MDLVRASLGGAGTGLGFDAAFVSDLLAFGRFFAIDPAVLAVLAVLAFLVFFAS
jgi:hypothetical protein